MQATHPRRHPRSPAMFGLILVVVGIVALVLRQVDVELVDVIGKAGWPFFVIIPGIALLTAAVVTPPPGGLGFAIAGSIVTTVGSILLYQESTDHWESWAYAWALIPAASGLATTAYGAAIRRRDLVAGGLRTALVAAVLFVAGFWFFETLFDSGRAPIDLSQWWPLLIIALGLLVAARTVVPSPANRPDAPTMMADAQDAPDAPASLPIDDVPALRGDQS